MIPKTSQRSSWTIWGWGFGNASAERLITDFGYNLRIIGGSPMYGVDLNQSIWNYARGYFMPHTYIYVTSQQLRRGLRYWFGQREVSLWARWWQDGLIESSSLEEGFHIPESSGKEADRVTPASVAEVEVCDEKAGCEGHRCEIDCDYIVSSQKLCLPTRWESRSFPEYEWPTDIIPQVISKRWFLPDIYAAYSRENNAFYAA